MFISTSESELGFLGKLLDFSGFYHQKINGAGGEGSVPDGRYRHKED